MKDLRRLILSSLVLIVFFSAYSQDYKNEKQLIKGADDAFYKGDFKTAIPLFSTLISNYPKDPGYNFKYGASLLIGEGDNEKPVKYLQFAVSKPDVDPLAYYYYAYALHLNYEFQKAIKYYKKFQNLGKPSDLKKFHVDDHISQCENGKTLLKTITDLIVLDKKELRDEDFYKVYDLTSFGGQILVKPDDFQTEYEKKNSVKGIFYFPKDADKIFFSRQSSEEGDKDIFYKVRNPDGTWSRGINMGKPINSKSDEDYPFLHPDGTTLYFASKGHNSLGGYDIFVSKIDDQGNWTEPQNLDFAINTPADDYLFITDLTGETAYFSSNRESPQGEVNVYKINMDRMPLDFAFVYGTFATQSTKKAKIKVVNAETDEVIGEYETDENGKYKIKVPNEGKFNFIVDYEGSKVAHSGQVEVQGRNTFKPLKQTMEVIDEGLATEKLVIKNLVDEDVDEEVELSADFFKNKAKLTINKDKFKDRKEKLDKEKTEKEAQQALANLEKESSASSDVNSGANSSGRVGAEAAGKAGTSITQEEKISTATNTDGPKLASADYSEAAKEESVARNTEEANGEVDNNSELDGANINSNKNQVANEGSFKSGSNSKSGAGSGAELGASSGSTLVSASGGNMGTGAAKIAVPLKIKKDQNTSNEEIVIVTENNKKALENDTEIFEKQAEVARSNSSVYSTQASQKKSKASEIIAASSGKSEEEKATDLKMADALLLEAELLDRKAKTSENLSTQLTTNSTKNKSLITVSDTYTSKVKNQTDLETNMESYNEFNSLIEASQEQQMSIVSLQDSYSSAYTAKQIEASNQRAKAEAMHEEVKEIEEDIEIKEKELESAKGKRKTELEADIAKDKDDLLTEKSRLSKEDKFASSLEKDAALAKMDLDAVNELIKETQTNAEINQLMAEGSYAGADIVEAKVEEPTAVASLVQEMENSKTGDQENFTFAENNEGKEGSDNSNSESNEESEIADAANNNSSEVDTDISVKSNKESNSAVNNTSKTSSSSNSGQSNQVGIVTESNINGSNRTGNSFENSISEKSMSSSQSTSSSSSNSTNSIKKVTKVAEGASASLVTNTGSTIEVGATTNKNGDAATMGANASNVIVSPKAAAIASAVSSGAGVWANEETDVMDALEIYDNGEMTEHEIAIIPDSNSSTVSHFNTNEVHEQLTLDDQSLRSINNEGYNQAYMAEFTSVMEEEGTPYEKAVKTYVINESWVLDIDREISYLDAISDEVPEEYQDKLNERIDNLEKLKSTKLNNTESSKEKVLDLAQSQGTSADLNQMANTYRKELAYTMAGIETVTEEELLAENTNAVQNNPSTNSLNTGANGNNTGVDANLANSISSNDSNSSNNSENQSGTNVNNSSSTSLDGASFISRGQSGDENISSDGSTSNSDEISSSTFSDGAASGNGELGNLNSSEQNQASTGENVGANSITGNGDIEAISNQDQNNLASTNSTSSESDQESSSSDNSSNGSTESSTEESSNQNVDSASNSSNQDSASENNGSGDELANTDNSNNGDINQNNDQNNSNSNSQSKSDAGQNVSQSQLGSNNSNSESNSDFGNDSESDSESISNNLTNPNSNDNSTLAGGNSQSSNGNASDINGATGNSTNVAVLNGGIQTRIGVWQSASSASVAGNSLADPEKKSYAPGQNTDRLAKVLKVSDKNVEDIVNEKTSESAAEKEILVAEVTEMETTLKANQDKMATAKRKEKKALIVEIAKQESDLADAQNQKEIAEYRSEALVRASDHIIALDPGEEKESEKEVKRSESLKVEAEEKLNSAEVKETEKARGKKKKAIKAAEVQKLKSEGDRKITQATASEELAKELAVLEADVLTAYKNTPEELPKSEKRLSQAEVNEVRTTPAFAEYDKLRKQASVYYEEAQVAYVSAEKIDNENKNLRAQLTELNAKEESESNVTAINELQAEMTKLEDKIAANEVQSTELKAESKRLYTEYNHTNNQAVRIVKSQDPLQQENLLAYVTELERLETYAVEPAPGSTLSQQEGQGYSPDKFSRVVRGIDEYPEELKDAIFDMIDFNKSLYNEENPIPVDTKLPGGVVFKVQIGAFRNAPPQDVFKGFAPVRGESTRPGWTRYTAGLFTSRDQAKLKRNEIRTLGYSDAFVVAYKDGKRISLTEADKLIAEGYTSPQLAQVSSPSNSQLADNVNSGSNEVGSAGEIIKLNDVQGLMYTVQVGAFRNQITSNELFGISPLVEYSQNGLFKYGSGIFNDRNKADEAQKRILALGVNDAFVTAFYNGRRVSMNEASQIATDQGAGVFAQEKPLSINNGPKSKNSANSNSNIVLRVQVGAYRQEVPVEDAKIILSLSNLGIDVQQEGGMTTYTVGRYSSYSDAEAIKDKVLGQGLKGAFIVAYNNNKRIEVSEAMRTLGQ